jgi:hypothetical protein
MDHWLHRRGGGSRFRRDRFHRAHAHHDSVPGGTDFRIDGSHLGGTGGLRRVCRPARDLLGGHIIVAGHISVGEHAGIPVGICIQVAGRIRIPEPVPVRHPDPDPIALPNSDPHAEPSTVVTSGIFGPADNHADEHITVRTSIGVAGADAGPASRGHPPGQGSRHRRSGEPTPAQHPAAIHPERAVGIGVAGASDGSAFRGN